VLFTLPVGMPLHLPLLIPGLERDLYRGEAASETTASV
jgi:hypothetical protein